jgi:hypothetical protein
MRQRSSLHVTSNDHCNVCSMSQWWQIILINVSADCLRLERENRSFVKRAGGKASPPRTLSLIAYHNLCRVNLHAFLTMRQRALHTHGVNPSHDPRCQQTPAVPSQPSCPGARHYPRGPCHLPPPCRRRRANVFIYRVIRSCAGGSDETRRGLCYDQHHVWKVIVVGTLPETLPCVLRGEVGPMGKGSSSPEYWCNIQ